jgi:hypothetical protein
MRSHGITNFPDPTFPGGHVQGAIPSSIDTKSRQFTQAAQTCAKLIPAGLPDSRPGWLKTMAGPKAGGGS